MTIFMGTRPHIQTGYARSASESQYPGLYRSLVSAIMPGVQGVVIPPYDFIRKVSDFTAVGSPSVVNGIYGSAFGFNGSSGGLSASTNLISASGPYPGSIVSWLRPNVTNAGGTIWGISNSATTGDNNVIELRFTGSARIQMRTETSAAQSIGFYSAGVWYCVGCTFISQADRSLWLDGVFQANSTVSQDKTGLDTTSIGYRVRPTPDLYFNGSVAGVLVFNRILSADEMRLLYRIPFAPFVRRKRIYSVGVTFIDLISAITSASSTTNINSTLSRNLSSAVTSVSSTTSIDVSTTRNLSSAITSVSATTNINSILSISLSSSITSTSSTTDIDGSIIRNLSSSITSVSSTIDINASTIRNLTSSITSISSTTSIDFQIFGSISLSSDILSISSTTDIDVFLERNLVSNIQSLSSTNDIDANIILNISSSISSLSQTTLIDVSLIRNLMSSISSFSSTTDIDSLIVRNLLSSILSVSNTSNIDFAVGALIELSSSINSISSTSLINATLYRNLISSIMSVSSTSIISVGSLLFDLNRGTITSLNGAFGTSIIPLETIPKTSVLPLETTLKATLIPQDN